MGAVATILAAAFYSIVTFLWSFSYGFAAASIGIAVGISMQFLGRGIEMKFAVVASAYTIAGCFLGNVFRVALYEARTNAISLPDVFQTNAFSVLAEQSASYVSFIDVVFWFVAVWFSVFLVKRPLSRADKLAIGMYELKG